MRDIFLTVFIFGTLPAIVWRPWLGVLVFSWFSYMNPHRLTWGFAQTMPFAMIIAVVTFLAWALSRENKKYPITPLTVMIVVFVLWCTFTTTQAFVPGEAWGYWLRYAKIMAMTFLTMIVIQDRTRLHALIWVIVVSIGFYGVKGGLFGLLSGGDYRVWGPPDSFIADNNALAMALVMLIPLVRFLRLEAKDRRIRLCLLGSIPLMILSILASYSRGGFLGLSAMLLFLVMKSKNRVGYGLLIVAATGGVLSLMPDKYYGRLGTIESSGEGEAHENPRLASWRFAIDVANERPIRGGGFNFFDSIPHVLKYAEPAAIQFQTPKGPVGRNMHSIYFEVLGTQGYVGLALFLVILVMAYRNCAWVRRRTKSRPDLAWANNLASTLQASGVGMCTAGAFLNLTFFDLTWHVIALTALVRIAAQRELAKPPPGPETAPARPETGRGPRKSFLRPAPARFSRALEAPRAPAPRRR